MALARESEKNLVNVVPFQGKFETKHENVREITEHPTSENVHENGCMILNQGLRLSSDFKNCI
jgi:hypothetical protein